MTKEYDYCVIGKGMIGSAAARHLSLDNAGSYRSAPSSPSAQTPLIAIIGPDEPTDWKAHDGVFASHYDSGRITRILDTDRVWATLAKHSIDRYREIENDSGIDFFTPVGCLKMAPDTDWGRVYIAANSRIGTALGAEFETLSYEDLKQKFPYLTPTQPSSGVLEHKTAGWIDPRKLIEAQLEIARRQGVDIIKATAKGVKKLRDGKFEITTDSGETVLTRNILLSAGAYNNFNGLLEEPLDLTVRAETIVMARIKKSDLETFKDMPSIILFMRDQPGLNYVYIVPPLEYPDGHYYLKMGGDREVDHTFHSMDKLVEWFHSDGGTEAAALFKQILGKLFPTLQPEVVLSKPCVITDTKTERPYIGTIDDGIYVATGGCGAAAKSSDEIGRVGALYARTQKIDPIYPSDAFRVVMQDCDDEEVLSVREFHF